jgi:DNA-binding NarL/FixJ family response regulator
MGDLRRGRRRLGSRNDSKRNSNHTSVILDFKMPLANGIEAGSEIHDKLPKTPIMMYTLYKTRELEVAAKLVGIRQVIGKEGGE